MYVSQKCVLLLSLVFTLFSLSTKAQFEIELSKVEIAGEDQAKSKKYTTEYNRNNIEFHLASLDTSQSKFDIIYRIGVHKFGELNFTKWDTISNVSSFKTDKLLPGKFLIQIKTIGSANTINTEIVINRPWWRTWWFWSASFITLFGLFFSRERLIKQWEDDEQKHHREIVELELRTLQLQMNPHFIFNALNSIQSYVLKEDTLTANDYLSKFAHLIRMFLDSSRTKYIQLKEEKRLLMLYCEMESLRFDNSFDFQISFDNSVNTNNEIPTMLLQPFVENAINHGLRYKKSKGFLKIHFSEDEEEMICTIKDNGVGRETAIKLKNASRKGYKSQGLTITEERLITYNQLNNSRITFHIKDMFTKEENEDQGTIVTVKFPLK